MESIFTYTNYKKYINHWINAKPGRGRGVQSAMARALNCQTTYVSQILKGRAKMSLEQADSTNRFMQHTRAESHFFILLVEFERAGTSSLRKHFGTQIEQVRSESLDFKSQLKVKPGLSETDQARYYSSWHYGAMHMLLSIPRFQNLKMLCESLRLEPAKGEEILQFLLDTGLAKKEGEKLGIGSTRLHLPSDSVYTAKNHTNWRIEAIKSIDRSKKGDLHYSSAVTLSKEDAVLIQSKIIDFIKELKTIIKDSPSEKCYSLNVDFFNLLNR